VAFEPLATTADLSARNISAPSGVDALEILAGASDAIRDAARCPISVTTSTVPYTSNGEQWLNLIGGPVTEVDLVEIDGDVVTDWKKLDNRLWRRLRWGCTYEPSEIMVTYTHGYPEIPRDIVDLACALAAMSFAETGRGYGEQSRLLKLTLGKLSKTFQSQQGQSPSPLAIPDAVARNLRERFGTTVTAIGRDH